MKARSHGPDDRSQKQRGIHSPRALPAIAHQLVSRRVFRHDPEHRHLRVKIVTLLPNGNLTRTAPVGQDGEAGPQHRKNRENAVATNEPMVAPTMVAIGDAAKPAPGCLSGLEPKPESPGLPRHYMEAGGTLAPVDDALAA